jgi:hypothetical protein
VPVDKGKSVERVIQQLVVKLRAETIRILDRSTFGSEQSNATKAANHEDIPRLGANAPPYKVSLRLTFWRRNTKRGQ